MMSSLPTTLVAATVPLLLLLLLLLLGGRGAVAQLPSTTGTSTGASTGPFTGPSTGASTTFGTGFSTGAASTGFGPPTSCLCSGFAGAAFNANGIILGTTRAVGNPNASSGSTDSIIARVEVRSPFVATSAGLHLPVAGGPYQARIALFDAYARDPWYPGFEEMARFLVDSESAQARNESGLPAHILPLPAGVFRSTVAETPAVCVRPGIYFLMVKYNQSVANALSRRLTTPKSSYALILKLRSQDLFEPKTFEGPFPDNVQGKCDDNELDCAREPATSENRVEWFGVNDNDELSLFLAGPTSADLDSMSLQEGGAVEPELRQLLESCRLEATQIIVQRTIAYDDGVAEGTGHAGPGRAVVVAWTLFHDTLNGTSCESTTQLEWAYYWENGTAASDPKVAEPFWRSCSYQGDPNITVTDRWSRGTISRARIVMPSASVPAGAEIRFRVGANATGYGWTSETVLQLRDDPRNVSVLTSRREVVFWMCSYFQNGARLKRSSKNFADWRAGINTGPDFDKTGPLYDFGLIPGPFGNGLHLKRGEPSVNRGFQYGKEEWVADLIGSFVIPHTAELYVTASKNDFVGGSEPWRTRYAASTSLASNDTRFNWYSFDSGFVHVLVLSTEDNYTAGSPQYAFAEEDLRQASAERARNASAGTAWLVVSASKPMYDSCRCTCRKLAPDPEDCGEYCGRQIDQGFVDAIEPLFLRYGVDFYIHGGSLSYSVTHPISQEAAMNTTLFSPPSGKGTLADPFILSDDTAPVHIGVDTFSSDFYKCARDSTVVPIFRHVALDFGSRGWAGFRAFPNGSVAISHFADLPNGVTATSDYYLKPQFFPTTTAAPSGTTSSSSFVPETSPGASAAIPGEGSLDVGLVVGLSVGILVFFLCLLALATFFIAAKRADGETSIASGNPIELEMAQTTSPWSHKNPAGIIEVEGIEVTLALGEQVYRGTYHGSAVAVLRRAWEQEHVAKWQKLNHPHVLQLNGMISYDDVEDEKGFLSPSLMLTPLLVTEWCDRGRLDGTMFKGSLRDTASSSTFIPYDEEALGLLCSQALSAVSYLVSEGVPVADFSASSLLITADGTVRICPPLVSASAAKKLVWSPPEAGHILGKTEIHLWASACWEIFERCDRLPFGATARWVDDGADDPTTSSVRSHVLAGDLGTVPRPELCPQALYESMCACWSTRPKDRPKPSELLSLIGQERASGKPKDSDSLPSPSRYSTRIRRGPKDAPETSHSLDSSAEEGEYEEASPSHYLTRVRPGPKDALETSHSLDSSAEEGDYEEG